MRLRRFVRRSVLALVRLTATAQALPDTAQSAGPQVTLFAAMLPTLEALLREHG